MNSADVVRIARQRAGLTQAEVAVRTGVPRETIARWETGVREPSLSSLRKLVDAIGLDLTLSIAEADESLAPLVRDQLKLSPRGRLLKLLPEEEAEGALAALRWLARDGRPAVVIGPMAAALQGAPQRPADGSVEVIPADLEVLTERLEAAGFMPLEDSRRWAPEDRRWPWVRRRRGSPARRITVASAVPGAHGYKGLRASAQEVKLGTGPPVQVAHPRDLVRLAEASQRESERSRIPGLQALLDEISSR